MRAGNDTKQVCRAINEALETKKDESDIVEVEVNGCLKIVKECEVKCANAFLDFFKSVGGNMANFITGGRDDVERVAEWVAAIYFP